MTRTRTILSILCVTLAGIMGLILAFIHPGWAIRLVRYMSRHMVGGRRLSKRRLGERTRQSSLRLPASKRSEGNALSDQQKAHGVPRAMGNMPDNSVRGPVGQAGRRHNRPEPSDLSQVPGAAHDVRNALVNLGMRKQDAGRLARSAVQGRDFDGALRWAIANRGAA